MNNIHSSFITQTVGEGEPFISRRNDGKGFYVSHPPFSLSQYLSLCFDGNTDRGFLTSSPMIYSFSNGGFTLLDYNVGWVGCTPPPFILLSPHYRVASNSLSFTFISQFKMLTQKVTCNSQKGKGVSYSLLLSYI